MIPSNYYNFAAELGGGVTFGFGFRRGIHKRWIQMRLLFFVLFSAF